IDYHEPKDEPCIERLRRLVGAHRADEPQPPHPFVRHASAEPPRPGSDLFTIMDGDPRSSYEVRDVLACLIDAGSFDEYKAKYGQTLVCGTARLGGFPVGIVANQRHRIKTARGEYQFGGVIYVDSA